ncbi:Protein of unknown function [Gryllus bimaculatus]|nr:Protein of unknown function [Gryllus bimaculatus]
MFTKEKQKAPKNTSKQNPDRNLEYPKKMQKSITIVPLNKFSEEHMEIKCTRAKKIVSSILFQLPEIDSFLNE